MKRYGPVTLATLLLVVPSCQTSKAKERLPPATGSGAPPVPSVPALASATLLGKSTSAAGTVVTGTARPLHEAKLGPKAPGTVAAMLVEEGDQVKQGQLLFRLDSGTQALAIRQAEAAVAAATVGADAARNELNRVRTLHERGSLAPATYDRVKAQFDQAEAAVVQAKAAASLARKSAGDTVVRSPIDGTVTARNASVGETVTMMPPTIVLVIQDISQLEVRARVPETMLRTLRLGQRVTVRFPSVGIWATVPIFRINPSVDPMTRTVEVIALVPNEDGRLMAGMLVELDFGQVADAALPAAPPSALAGPAEASRRP